ncbi:Plasmodium vivax Vir protein, putative [Plasmodium vivax]|uniref:Vir protein, putative n=1 Tax=Plasmodium vivax TaxID=5855 RepID=A0A1G4E9I3_PLAVI|nr:Plasmodium vivax Vir protein, putative [Plasmodium vivax]
MAEILNKEYLEQLESKYFYYQKFNKSKYSYCSDDFPYATIKNKINQYVKNENISEKLVNGICSFNIQDEGDFCNTLCDYFYYWIGDKVYDLVKSEEVFTKIIDTIYSELSRNAKQYKCKCTSKHKTKENFKKIKIAYDYYNDYGTLEEHLKNNNKLCDADYHNYLNNAVETYNSVFNECYSDNEPDYCIQLKKFIPIFSENMLSPLKCDLTNVNSEVQHMQSSSFTASSKLGDAYAIPPYRPMLEVYSSRIIFSKKFRKEQSNGSNNEL